ncbi:uncharacterized protein LOC130390619 [Gadus chalcogrammus]|uniref:uncharacterized protein LOC130390619 n=1 Tax=Gadus chalcogrammus TaxID=1042646 RepID=UPI0024C47B55|nr:uncharacterized protein LOC130390619 [Gadus chalcogrammus]
MSVEDFCRLCKGNLRIKGTLSNTKKIFPLRRVPNEKSVNERLMALGLTLSNDNSRSGRICRSCFRLVVRIEEDFAVFKKWHEAEKESVPETPSTSLEERVPGEEVSLAISGVHSIPPVSGEKRARERSPSETTNYVNKKLCTETPTPKLSRPTAEMPVRRSLTEVIIHYPSNPKGDKMECQANIAGIVENITKENWRTAANLIVRHKELFGRLKENFLKVIEDESKLLCNPYKGFMLWRSSAADLKAFTFANLLSDLERLSPFMFSIFSKITKRSPHSTCAAAAIALRGREPRLSAFAYCVDSVLMHGGAKKEVFKRLSKLGISTSHSSALTKQKESKLLAASEDIQNTQSRKEKMPVECDFES